MNRLLALVLLLLAFARPLRADGTIDFVLVLDESGSMEYAQPISDPNRLRVDSAKLFVQLCGPSDRVGVVGFGEKVELHTGPTLHGVDRAWKSFVWQRLTSVSGLQAYTDMLGGLSAAVDLLDRRPTRPDKTFIVFLTDGRIDGPRDLSEGIMRRHGVDDLEAYKRKLLSLADSCGSKGYTLLAIGLGSGADGSLLTDLASRGGGRYWQAAAATELQAIYSDIFVNLADRFSLKAQNASSPIKVNIEPGLKEFVALAFPRDGVVRKKPFIAGFKLVKADGTEVPSEISATKSWSAARLRDPEPGVWEIRFDPSLKVDVLLVKYSGCRIRVNSPNLPEYPPGRVPFNVQVTDPAGKPADVCAGEMEAEITGPGLPSPATVKLTRTGPGQFAAPSPKLSDEGEYTATLRAFAPGGREFVNQRTITFRIKVQPPREINLVIRRPDAPAYRAGGAVPIEVEVTAPDGAPLTPGQVTLDPTLSGPAGALAAPSLTEESPGLFKGHTGVLTAPGSYSVGIRATFGGDPRTSRSASKDFVIAEAPVESLKLTPLGPKAGAYYPGALELRARLTRGDANAPVGPADGKVSVDISGPGATQKVTLSGNHAGIWSGQTPALTKPGKYTATFTGTLAADPRSIASGKAEFEIRAPTLAITNIRLEGDQPLFTGEPFDVRFDVKAAGITGAPKVEVVITPPGQNAEPFSAQADQQPDGSYKVHQDTTTLGAGRVDITASASAAGAPITTASAVPMEAFLDVRSYPHSIEAGSPSTYTIGILSLFPDPVNAGAEVNGVAPAQGGSGSVPTVTPSTASIPLTRPETTDDFTAFTFNTTPPSDTYGPFKADVTVTIAGRYPDGQEFVRSKKFTTQTFEITKPPASPAFWLFLLACAAAAFWARPNFGGTWLKVNDQRVGVGERTGLFDTRVGVGGPEQPVSVVEEECTPVILTAGWMGKFRRETTEGSFELKSGDSFEVGRTQVTFIKGAEPKKKPEPPGGAAPEEKNVKAGSLDDIA